MAAGIFNANATDASNSTFSSINLAENVMNPSDVNNMFRAIFGAQKRWLLDLGGTVAVGGTATGITITLNESTYTGYGTSANQIPDGAVLMIETTSASAAGGTTLNVNSIGTKKILRMGGIAIAAGDWVSGQFLLLRYDSSADSSTGAWIHVNPMAGRILGTTTNDAAAAGYVGELLSSVVTSGSAVNVSTSGTSYDVTSKQLTAGDWIVWGEITMTTGAARTSASQRLWINTTSATAPGLGINDKLFYFALPAAAPCSLPIVGPFRVSLASATTYYLSMSGAYTGGSSTTAYGGLYALRVR